jgi:hypothetical protein
MNKVATSIPDVIIPKETTSNMVFSELSTIKLKKLTKKPNTLTFLAQPKSLTESVPVDITKPKGSPINLETNIHPNKLHGIVMSLAKTHVYPTNDVISYIYNNCSRFAVYNDHQNEVIKFALFMHPKHMYYFNNVSKEQMNRVLAVFFLNILITKNAVDTFGYPCSDIVEKNRSIKINMQMFFAYDEIDFKKFITSDTYNKYLYDCFRISPAKTSEFKIYENMPRYQTAQHFTNSIYKVLVYNFDDLSKYDTHLTNIMQKDDSFNSSKNYIVNTYFYESIEITVLSHLPTNCTN